MPNDAARARAIGPKDRSQSLSIAVSLRSANDTEPCVAIADDEARVCIAHGRLLRLALSGNQTAAQAVFHRDLLEAIGLRSSAVHLGCHRNVMATSGFFPAKLHQVQVPTSPDGRNLRRFALGIRVTKPIKVPMLL